MYTRVLDFLVNTGYLGVVIAGLAEPLLLPFPMELIFIPVAISNNSKTIYYGALLIGSSFIGSCIAYIIGRFGGKKLELKFKSSNSYFSNIQDLYSKNAFLAILTSSFTPIPYEVYTYSAGIFNINFKKFAIAALLSRSIRYIPQSILISLYGENIVLIIKNYGVVSAIILVLIFVVIRQFVVTIRKGR